MDDQIEKVLMPKLKTHDIVKIGRKIGVVAYNTGPAAQAGSTVVRFRREADGQLGAACIFRWGTDKSGPYSKKPRVVTRLGIATLNTVLSWHDGVETVMPHRFRAPQLPLW